MKRFTTVLAVLFSVSTLALCATEMLPTAHAAVTMEAVPRAAMIKRALLNRLSRRTLRVGVFASRSSTRSSASSASSASSRASSASSAALYDALPYNVPSSGILLLHETSPIIAGAKFFSTLEPVQLNGITITFSSAPTDIDALRIYAAGGRYLGTATQLNNVGTSYRLPLKAGAFDLPRRDDRSIYMRAQLKAYENGGVGGQNIEISSVEATGYGMWANEEYIATSTDTFNILQSARGVITSITPIGGSEGTLAGGQGQQVAAFSFRQRATDGEAKVRVTDLVFQIEGSSSDVTLTNPKLRIDSEDTVVSCSVSGVRITCAGLPTTFGTIGSEKTFKVYADISIAGSVQNPSLRLTLNVPGTPSSSGDVTWTDGTTSFTWLPMGQPVARGTLYR